MFHTRVTEMLGIQYPIIQGAMLWLSGAELSAAVSNAGGLGIIASMNFDDKASFREELRKTKDLTDKPFGVNINLFPTVRRKVSNEEYIEILAEEGVRVVETAGRSPEPHMELFRKAGIKVVHKVPSVRFAQSAEKVGVDAVTVVGFECGGVPGMDDVPTFVLVPRASDCVKIPLIAGGGVGDARGLVAALVLGAEGVLMGTRFMATKECWAHPNVKEWMVQATERDTLMITRSLKEGRRVMKTETAQKALDMESRGASLEELLQIIGGELGKKVYATGDIQAGVVPCGQVTGLIDNIPSVQDVIEDMVNGAEAILERLRAEGMLKPMKKPL